MKLAILHARWKRFRRFFNRYRHILWLNLIVLGLVGFFLLIPGNLRKELLDNLVRQRRLALMLLIFGLLSLSLLWSFGQRLDIWTFLYFNLRGNRPKWLDWTMLGITQGGNGLTAFLIAAIFYVRDRQLLAYAIVFGTLTLWLVVEFVKAIIQRARPFEKLIETRVVGVRASGRSFPSGHTSQAFFLITLLAQNFHVGPIFAVLLYFVGALVGITRMYVGAHYPRDVLAGAILGSLWGIIGGMINAQLSG